jgi:hypothetical protein
LNSASPSDATITAQIKSRLSRLNRKGIGEVSLFLSNDDQFRTDGHDRYMRFDNNVCTLGIGIDLFRGTRVRQTTMFSMIRFQEETRQREQRLKGISGSPILLLPAV